MSSKQLMEALNILSEHPDIQEYIKSFDVLDYNLRSVGILQFPDARAHVRRTCYQTITLSIPVDGAYFCCDLSELAALDMRQRREWSEVIEIVATEVPDISDVMTSSRHKQPLLRIKLSEVNIASVLVF